MMTTSNIPSENAPCSRALFWALKNAVEQGDLDALAQTLDCFDPNVLREHRGGMGNAFHQTMEIVLTHLSETGRSHTQEIYTLLVEKGVRTDMPCQSYHKPGQEYDDIFDWFVCFYQHQTFEYLQDKLLDRILPAMLTAGTGWKQLHTRDDSIGEVVRQHPAYKRHILEQVVGQVKPPEKQSKPKI